MTTPTSKMANATTIGHETVTNWFTLWAFLFSVVEIFFGFIAHTTILYIILLLPLFFMVSPVSRFAKLQIGIALLLFSMDLFRDPFVSTPLRQIYIDTFGFRWGDYVYLIVSMSVFNLVWQPVFRFKRLNHFKRYHGFNSRDPSTYEHMNVEDAQEIERNLAEWEFPRLYQFAWVSDFLRTATDPGVSRALVRSGHMINRDPMVEHERLQATIHLMSGLVSYDVKSVYHSLVVARINEHHHRYGTMINSDDVLYLIIHFAFAPVSWIKRFGYRKLETFEIHALWVLWREIACRMGVKYVPVTVGQAKEWRSKFERRCRWREPANEIAATAMLEEILWLVPTLLKPLARKLVVSIIDNDVVYYCQLEKFRPSSLLRTITYGIFRGCALWIRYLGFPRLSAYKRSPEAPSKKTGLMVFSHTPYDTMPFYQEHTFWNRWGYGALLRRARRIPVPGPDFYGFGVTFEAMGVSHPNMVTQRSIEQKVRERAIELQNAPYGYRSSVGYQAGRLVPRIDGCEYGSPVHAFPKSTPLLPATPERFEPHCEKRGPGYSKLRDIRTPDDSTYFDSDEYQEAQQAKKTEVAQAPQTIPQARKRK